MSRSGRERFEVSTGQVLKRALASVWRAADVCVSRWEVGGMVKFPFLSDSRCRIDLVKRRIDRLHAARVRHGT